MATGRARLAAVFSRSRSVCCGTASRCRRLRCVRRAGPGSRRGNSLVRWCRPDARQNRHDPDPRRVCGLAYAPRRDRSRERGRGGRGRADRTGGCERRRRVADALRAPGDPRLAGCRRLRRSIHAAADAGSPAAATVGARDVPFCDARTRHRSAWRAAAVRGSRASGSRRSGRRSARRGAAAARSLGHAGAARGHRRHADGDPGRCSRGGLDRSRCPRSPEWRTAAPARGHPSGHSGSQRGSGRDEPVSPQPGKHGHGSANSVRCARNATRATDAVSSRRELSARLPAGRRDRPSAACRAAWDESIARPELARGGTPRCGRRAPRCAPGCACHRGPPCDRRDLSRRARRARRDGCQRPGRSRSHRRGSASGGSAADGRRRNARRFGGTRRRPRSAEAPQACSYDDRRCPRPGRSS